MMQAYLFMKGPGTDMEDPLMTWISEQEDEDQEHRERGSVNWRVTSARRRDNS